MTIDIQGTWSTGTGTAEFFADTKSACDPRKPETRIREELEQFIATYQKTDQERMFQSGNGRRAKDFEAARDYWKREYDAKQVELAQARQELEFERFRLSALQGNGDWKIIPLLDYRRAQAEAAAALKKAEDRAIARDLDNEELRKEIEKLEKRVADGQEYIGKPRSELDGYRNGSASFRSMTEEFWRGDGWLGRNWSAMLPEMPVPGTRFEQIPMKFVLDVNMPPDTVVIRNSNGVEATITGTTVISNG